MLLKASPSMDVKQYSPLALAFLGDAVYELLVREQMVFEANMPVQKLHHRTVSWVCAHAQSEAVEFLLPILTDEEMAVYKRGRNAKSHAPKNASVQEYRRATGFEAIFGYLYLQQKEERMKELFAVICEHLEIVQDS